MATGSGPLGVNLPSAGVSDITPTYAVPNAAPLYEQMGDAFARLAAPVQNALDRRAARAGAKAAMEAADRTKADIEAGKTPQRPETSVGSKLVGIVTHGAYESAFNTATLARLKSDLDTRAEAIRGQYQYDPAGYEKASQAALSGFIHGAPEHLAVDVEQYGRAKFNEGLGTVSRVSAERERLAAATDLGARVLELNDRLSGLASSGSLDSDEFYRTEAERTLIQLERQRNPAIIYTPAEREYDDHKLYDSLHGAAAAHGAAQAYGDAGGGLPGRASAYRFLSDEILNGEALKDIDPSRRQKIFRDARAQIDQFTAADVELKRQQEADERAKRAEQRETVGGLRLGAMLGEIGERDIKARLDISDADKASLLAGVRSEKRRERIDARMAAAAERQGEVAIYRELADGAHAGTLSDGDIADALGSGHITPGKAATLRVLRDRSLKPIVDDVMAPVKDAAARFHRRPSHENLALAEDQAAQFARANPGAGLADRLKAGEAIASRVFGAKTAPGPTAATGAAAQRAGVTAKLDADFRAGRIDRTTYNSKMRELINGGH
jgi:hypothetical protein